MDGTYRPYATYGGELTHKSRRSYSKRHNKGPQQF